MILGFILLLAVILVQGGLPVPTFSQLALWAKADAERAAEKRAARRR